MNTETRNKIDSGIVKIPDGWEIIYEEDIHLLKEWMLWHWPDGKFYSYGWWYRNDPKALFMINFKITPFMVVIKKSEPKVYQPIKPEKSSVIKNVKRLIKR